MTTVSTQTSRITDAVVTASVPTPVGDVCIAVHGETVVACGFADHWDAIAGKVAVRFPGVAWEPGDSGPADALRAYVAGDLSALDALVVDTGGTDFQRRVWAALRTIPTGVTWSYTQLAEAVSTKTATRAVGSANGANPVSLVVPCHRVVRSDGTLGGYGGGLARKSWLLAHEGARLLG